MIHHISIAAHNPLHVSQVLAELLQGQSVPFPGHLGSYVALAFDPQGTMIEVHPFGTALVPGNAANEPSHLLPNPAASIYTANHTAISVPVNTDRTARVRQWDWWFRGGGDAAIVARFSPLLERAIRGELDDWEREPQSRLALILILDQFSRTIYRGTDRAFAQDEKACALTISGIELGHYTALETPWEKTFFLLPLGHSEQIQQLELSVQLADALVDESLLEYRSLLEFSAAQARRHRDVVARFSRHPHRNDLLGRISTPAELEYLASGQLVHKQPFPPDLSQFLIRH